MAAKQGGARSGSGGVLRCAAIGAILAMYGPGMCARDDAADTAIAAIKPEAIRADMRFLADDLLEGRATGSRGHLAAAHYVASRFEGMGLEPAGVGNTYFQDVPIRSERIDEAASGATLNNAGQKAKLTFREDYILRGDPGRREVDVEAPIVFAGFGITAPSQGYDDYEHIDVRGKIVAVLFGAPNFSPAVKAHYSAGWLKRQNAAVHGALGFLQFDDPVLEKLYPFKERVRDLAIPDRNWLDSQGRPNQYYPQLELVGFLSMSGVQRFLAGSGHGGEEIYAAARAELAFNGRAAIAAYLTESWDLVLMDVQMPEMDGIAATRAIRDAERASGRRPVPIIALTASAMPHERLACLGAGMDGVLAKPVTGDGLRRLLLSVS